jgi:hypothetical protein
MVIHGDSLKNACDLPYWSNWSTDPPLNSVQFSWTMNRPSKRFLFAGETVQGAAEQKSKKTSRKARP